MIKRNSIGLFPGRFQGVTKAHKTIIDLMFKHSEMGCGVMLIRNNTSAKNKDKNPFNANIRWRMIFKILPPNCKLFLAETAFIPDFIEENSNGSNPKFLTPNIMKLPIGPVYSIYAGPDRIDGYRSQIKYMKTLDKRLIVYDAESMLGGMNRNDFSGTEFRKALRARDKEKFLSLAPDEIHDMYDELVSII